MSTSPAGAAPSRSDRPVPRASYRLQLNKDFTFADVTEIADYLGRLGISHSYLSPVLMARPGSTHGYDTVDHTRINPELGTLEEFRTMAAALRARGISIILDIVPNHMGIGGDQNPYWLDVLEWGHDSQYADWFDINWSPAEPTLRNKVLMPFLGSSFGAALDDGRLQLRFDREAGSLAIWAEDTHKLPLDPRSYGELLEGGSPALRALAGEFETLLGPAGAGVLKTRLAEPSLAGEVETLVAALNQPDARGRLATIIERQNWRAARYSVAADDINYRRFFIVSDLAAIRIDHAPVFDHVHRLTFQLVEEGWVDGLRVDHIDGLLDPKAYALELRRKCPRPIYLVVEKILAPHEQVRLDWDVDGTTGYEFANAATRLLVHPDSADALSEGYEAFTGETASLEQIEREAKLDIIDYEMAAELDMLTQRLRDIALQSRQTSDITYNTLRNAVRLLVADMPVYRIYPDGGALSDEERRNLSLALGKARAMAPTLDPAVFEFLEAVMSGTTPTPENDRRQVVEATQRLQQYTGPVMAKGLEDTALYRFNRLLALSDVGEKPDRFGANVDAFHDFNAARAATVPHGMLTTSSHDTKRGEDTRARIAALSFVPDAWAAAVGRWVELLGNDAAGIARNDLYYLFQQLVGAWPTTLVGAAATLDDEALTTFRGRSFAAMQKALREARLRSSWTVPDADYEQRIEHVIARMTSPDGYVLEDLLAFESLIGEAGARNGLVEAALKLTVPGMPDIYQGAELWEQSMVDPDNRRAVDYRLRRALLNEIEGQDLAALMPDWRRGGVKLALIERLLKLRQDVPELFAAGSYEPLAMAGGRGIAFVRRLVDTQVLVAASLEAADREQPFLADPLPQGAWRDVLGSGATGPDALAAVFPSVPVIVLKQ